MSEISAYEKMLNDGTAFKRIDMDKIGRQMNKEASISANASGKDVGVKLDKPVGEPIKENDNFEYDDTDFSEIDKRMMERMNSLKSKMKKTPSKNENKEIAKLKKRVKRLEEALMLVMEVHSKLIEN